MIKTPQYNWFGRGFKLRAAITIACQMAFVLFGYDQGVFGGMQTIATHLQRVKLTLCRYRGQPQLP